jgi:hypothetical protein
MAEDPADDISELFDKALTMIERGDDPKRAANWFRSQGPDAMTMLMFREVIAFDMVTVILESKSSDVPGIRPRRGEARAAPVRSPNSGRRSTLPPGPATGERGSSRAPRRSSLLTVTRARRRGFRRTSKQDRKYPVTPDDDPRKYESLIMSLTSEMPARKVADRILNDHPDLAERAHWAALFVSNVSFGLQALDDADPEDVRERRKLFELLDVIFYMLGGEDVDDDDESEPPQ